MTIRKKNPAAEVGQRRGYFSDIGLSRTNTVILVWIALKSQPRLMPSYDGRA